MHALGPRRKIGIENLSTRVEAGNVLVEVTATSLTEDVRVICWRADGYGSRRSAPKVTQVVGDSLQLVRTELHLIKKYHVVGGFRLALWLAFVFGEDATTYGSL